MYLSAVSNYKPSIGPKDGSLTQEFKSAIAFDKAEIVTDENEKHEALRTIANVSCQSIWTHLRLRWNVVSLLRLLYASHEPNLLWESMSQNDVSFANTFFARLHLRALQGVCDTPLHFAAINRKQMWAKKHINEVMRGYNYILLYHLELYKRWAERS